MAYDRLGETAWRVMAAGAAALVGRLQDWCTGGRVMLACFGTWMAIGIFVMKKMINFDF